MTTQIRNIIYVDDDQDMLSLIKIVLESNQEVTVNTFISPNAALQEIEKNAPDMIILDYFMLEMKGTTIMKKIKERNPNIPIIFFTAQSAPEEIEKIIELGASKVFVKPISINDLPRMLMIF